MNTQTLHSSRTRWLGALLLFACLPAAAADWRFIGQFKDGGKEFLTFYDASSVKKAGNTVHFWTEDLPKKPVKDLPIDPIAKAVVDKLSSHYVPVWIRINAPGDPTADPKAVASATIEITRMELVAVGNLVLPAYKNFFEMDCSGQRVRQTIQMQFGPDGSQGPTINDEKAAFKRIPPDTTTSSEFAALCGK